MSPNPHFVRLPVRSLQTIGHLVTPDARCGVYVLIFDNGDRYVGKAVDVVRRFAAHRRRYPDICEVMFSTCRPVDLDGFELAMIRNQRAEGRRLRNITHALGPIGPSDLDPKVTPDEQQAWLTDDVFMPDDGPRIDDPPQRARGAAAFELLSQHDSFDFITAFTREYVQSTMPKPRTTERDFWVVSCLPSTGRRRDWRRLVVISVNKMETFVVGELLADGIWRLTGFVVVSRTTLESDVSASLMELNAAPQSFLELSPAHYEATGGDGAVIGWDDSAESFDALCALPWPDAAATLNLSLMRKGRTLQRRYHNFAFADLLLSEVPAAD